MKKYLSLREVAEILAIEQHKIRYWDEILKLSVGKGAKERLGGGNRYFDNKSLKKLEKLKGYLDEKGNLISSINMAKTIISNKSEKYTYENNNSKSQFISYNNEKIQQILHKMRNLVKDS